MEAFETFKRKMNANLKEAEALILQYSAKMEKASADARGTLQKNFVDLGEKKRTFEQKLTELQQAGAESGEQVKKKVENAWDDLTSTLKRSTEQLNDKMQ